MNRHQSCFAQLWNEPYRLENGYRAGEYVTYHPFDHNLDFRYPSKVSFRAKN